MLTDTRGLAVTAASPGAVAALDHTLDGYMGLRADVGDRLKATLAADPDFPLALTARGYFLLLFALRPLAERARQSLAAAEAAAAKVGANDRERAHMAALRAWGDGDAERALQVWEAILAEYPRDVLALRLAHFWHFYLGDAGELCSSVARAVRGWDESVPGCGYVLGCYAFGLEESGDYASAERIGRRAVELNGADAWATHAVAHVMEMQDRPQDGAAWLTERIPHLAGGNNFRFHVFWHRCLFLLDLGQVERVLELYDREVRAESTSDYLDICNAASLLWRLEDAGVDVGHRWAELATQSAQRLGDHSLIFADAHFALALAAADPAGADRFVDSARRYASAGTGTEAGVMREIGAALCEAMVAYRRGAFGRVVELLLPRHDAIRRVGGSHAQRDLFAKMLILAAEAAGRRDVARELLARRQQQRPNNAWGKRLAERLA
jgi:hypothetical protein